MASRLTSVVSLVVTLSVAAASVAAAQISADHGVNAFRRGDYQRAADILKPLAERWPGPVDPVALFFTASMYENGLGLAWDPVRGCALYLRASSMPGPFRSESFDRLRALRDSLGPENYAKCELLGNVGFDLGFEPVTFALEPAHWIRFDLTSKFFGEIAAAITYRGRQRRIQLTGLGLSSGTRVLPIEHTELVVDRAAPARRHFIQAYFWRARSDQRWMLDWHLLEVVRDQLILVTDAELVTITAAQPPIPLTDDLRRLARVHVNDAGDAEWEVLSGLSPRRELIETDAERQEAEEQRRRRRAAEERIDWDRTSDPSRTPALTYADADGCSDLFVYAWSDDRTEAITVRARKHALQLSAGVQTFDLALQPAGLEVAVQVFKQAARSSGVCRDLSGGETWTPTSGTVSIELTPPGVRRREPDRYMATIRIVGAEFVNATGVRVRQTRPITLTAVVGGLRGG